MGDGALYKAAVNAAATLTAIYEWLDRVEKAGGATSISGVAACNAMLKSLRANEPRLRASVLQPLADAIAARETPVRDRC